MSSPTRLWATASGAGVYAPLATEARTLATLYHGCQRQICGFESEEMRVEHYLTVFARALGIEFEDKFKKYRHWQDPERVLADTTPCQLANGVDPERARSVVEETFAPGTATPTRYLPS